MDTTMEWVETSARAGNYRIVGHAEITKLSTARHITDPQAARRDAGLPFETEHYWYRPARTRDYVRIATAAARAQRALLVTWNRAGVSVPPSMIE